MRSSGRKSVSKQSTRMVRWTLYVLGSLPALWTYHLALGDRLGADPLKVLEHTLGVWSLRFLVIGLAIRPLHVLGGPNLVAYRRAVGLLAFAYAALHVLVYAWLDQGLDLAAIIRDILKRPYITIGLLAFLILVPLAVTSNAAMLRALGGKAWGALHRWVYVAAILAVLHFIMLRKTWSPEPLLYAALFLVLLLWRVWKHWIGKPRRRVARSQRTGEEADATARSIARLR